MDPNTPPVARSVTQPPIPGAPPPGPRKSWWGRNWKWVVPVGCLTPIIVCGGLITLGVTVGLGAIKSSDVYQQSLAAAQADARVQQALGTPVEPGFLVTGNIDVQNSSGRADLTYPISGPKGGGTVHAMGDMAGGAWTLNLVVVKIDASGEEIDVLAGASP